MRQARNITHTQRHNPALAMSDEEREAIRKVGAEDTRRSRAHKDSLNGLKIRQRSPC